MLKGKFENLTNLERNNKPFIDCFTALIKKTERVVLMLEPLEDDPSKYLREILATPLVTNPAQVFSTFIDKSALQQLKVSVYMKKLHIRFFNSKQI